MSLSYDGCGFSEAEVQRLKTNCEFFFGQWHGAGTQVENYSTPVWLAPRAGAEPVPLCPVYPPAPSWLQRKSLCCSETNSSDPDCFPSRGLKSVGKQTQLNGVNLSPPKGGPEHWVYTGRPECYGAKCAVTSAIQTWAGQVQRGAGLRPHGFCEVTWSGKMGLRVQKATNELEKELSVSAVLVGLVIQSSTE